MRAVRLIAVLGLALAACGPGREAARQVLHVLPESRFPNRGEGVGDGPVAWVRAATSPEMRQRGLMFVKSLGPDRGMLFIYPDPRPLEFWMKNVEIPLSICFADPAGRIVRILEMLPGERGGLTYESLEPAVFALEMNPGWFRAKGIRIGDELKIDPEILMLPVR